MPNPAAGQAYKVVQISTSSPGEILLALYDGLFKFLLVARHALEADRRAAAGQAMSRAHAIISELYTTLDHDQYPELCDNLTSLYEFCMARMTHANLKRDPRALDDVMRVLAPVREGFQIAVKQAAQDLAAKEATRGGPELSSGEPPVRAER